MAVLQQSTTTGWREWLAMPNLAIKEIEAKVDTGTETSILHTSFIESFRKQGRLWLRFGIHPLPNRTDVRTVGFAPVKERRLIKDAEGYEEMCFVIETVICIGGFRRQIELTLTTKDAQAFRMVLGRSALRELNFLVDANHTHLLGDQRPQTDNQLQNASG
jgi:hypothetical protein